MKRFLHAAVAVWAFTLPVDAQDSPVVVELFTSQGCSSCPPADEIMQVLAERDDVIALSLHVDYWDYIGWKDEFAHPGNAERQRAYASAGGRRSIYTPEMIVNGVSDIVGAKPMAVATAIEDHKSKPQEVSMDLMRRGEQAVIAATPLVAGLEAMDVIMLRYQPARVARITRGENAGKTITYVNVTQDWQYISTWDGTEAFSLVVDAPDDFPIVVLIQTQSRGPIRAAAQLP